MHFNPYETAALPELIVEPRPVRPIVTLMLSYAATAASGGVFGIWAGPIGMGVGFVIASVIGIVIFMPAILFGVLCKSPGSICTLAGICGGLTGFLSVFLTFGSGLDPAYLPFAIAAMFIGGGAAAVTAWLTTADGV